MARDFDLDKEVADAIEADDYVQRVALDYREQAESSADPVGYALTTEGRKILATYSGARIRAAVRYRRLREGY
jgi:hypothetical protein